MEAILLILHIVSGFTALAAGIFIFLTRKGNTLHIKVGLLFYYSMLLVSISALFLSIFKNSEFLFCIGIFAFFQTYFGKRSIANKSLKPSPFDYVVTLLGIANGVYMIQTLNIVLLVFGVIQVQLGAQVLLTFYRIYSNKELHPKAWLKQHIGMMMGSFIATITAFLVVNIQWIHPEWIVWLSPTIILVPVMMFWTRKFTAR
jgi:hypothetical protein